MDHIKSDSISSCSPTDISNPKYDYFLNTVLQYSYCILRTSDHNFDFDNIEAYMSKCLFDTANVCSSQGVDELKFKLANYNNVFSGLTQEDASEGLMLLIDIAEKGFFPSVPLITMYPTGILCPNSCFHS